VLDGEDEHRRQAPFGLRVSEGAVRTRGIIGPVSADEDWRLTGQEEYLQGATLLRKRYRAWSAEWDHDHCEFCWAKFRDPMLSSEEAQILTERPGYLTEGYAVVGRRPDGAERTDYWWVCPACVKDFAERFEWVVQEEPTPP
jgi:hypothetical protein